MTSTMDIRPSPIAGRWYPGNPEQLAESVDSYLERAQMPEIQGDVIGVVAPHAGHVYSGPVAGYAFSAVRGLTPEVVAVIAPMHYPYPHPLLTTAHSAYETPLGVVPVDQEALVALDSILQDTLGFGLVPVRRDPEHSLEIEIPFLQRSLKGEFHLLPVMVRDQSSRVAEALGHALSQILRDRPALLVASTDLSHFYPEKTANELDSTVLHQVEVFNPQGVMDVDAEGKGYACGKAALAAVLWAAQDLGANQVQMLHYATSGDVTGDYEQVVGYGAAALTRVE